MNSIAGVSDEVIDEVRDELERLDRTYISVKHIDADAPRSEIGRALSHLENEGELELYHDPRARSLYTRPEESPP